MYIATGTTFSQGIYNQRLNFANVQLIYIHTVCLSRETGLTQLRRSSENPYDCSQSLPVFVCTTSGLGDTVLSLSSVDGEPLRYRHSRYSNDVTTVPVTESHYRELIPAVNLSKSTDKECFDRVNMTDSICYTITFIVHLTDRTICSTVYCSTVFNNGIRDIEEQFGSAIVTTSKHTWLICMQLLT